MRRNPPTCHKHPLIEELEPRLLFSADFAPVLADALAPQVEQRVIGMDGEFANTTDSQLQAQHAQFEVVFLDLRVQGYQQILADIHEQNTSGRAIEVVLLDAERDGVAQIGDFLSRHHDIDAVHIISHGSAGSLELGSGQLNFDSLVQNATAIKQWGNALSSEADILLYGCDLTSTTEGQSLVDALAKLTGADVAASDDKTGAASLGGDWVLEYQVGRIETNLALDATGQAQWQGTLANVAPTATNLSAAETYTEDTPLNLTDIVVSDVDSANVTVTLTLSAPVAGGLNTGTSGAVTSTYVAGTGVWTASGAIANINTLLAGLTFTPTLNYNANFSIATSVSDGVAAPITGSKLMMGTPVNDAPTFIAGGTITTEISLAADEARAVAIQADGKIVVAGSVSNGATLDFALVRYNADGTLDISFGTGGIVTTDFAGSNDAIQSIAVQSDGKIVVAGYATIGGTTSAFKDFAVARYNADGSLDTSFNGTGKVTTDFNAKEDTGFSVVIQSDGKIVVGGEVVIANTDFGLVRYNADGSLDTSFDGDGKAVTNIASNTDSIRAIALQSDGKIVVAGYTWVADADFALARYNTDGSLDTSFDGDGIVVTSIGPANEYAGSLAIQADGKIVAAGWGSGASNYDFQVARYLTNGALDTSFNGNGKATIAVGSNADSAYTVAIQIDGKILLAGESANATDNDFALVRLNADGSLDTSFDSDGKVTTRIGSASDSAYAMALQTDGRIVIAGRTSIGGQQDVALARYNQDGSLDAKFRAVNSLDATPTYTENGAAVVLDGNVRIFDEELGAAGSYAGATLTLVRNGGASIQDAFSGGGPLSTLTQGGNLVLSGVTIGTVTTNSAGTLVLTFNSAATQSRVDEALRSIRYSNSSNTPPASAQINWTFSDANSGTQGSGGALAAVGSVTVNIIAVNDAPTTNNVSASANEDAASIAITLTGSDIDGTVDYFRLSSLPANGTLYTDAGLTVAAAINTDYAATANALSLYFKPNTNWNGVTAFQYAAKDDGSAVDATPATATITVNAVNDAPTATNLSAAETYTEDTPLNLIDIVVSDVDSANVTVTLTLSAPAAGSLNTATSGAVTSTYVAGTGVWTASGAIADVNALLAGLTFTPSLNYNANFSVATSVSDGVAAPITGSKVITGIPVNDIPVAADDRLALNFDGVDDYVLVPNSPSLVMGSTMTMEAWINPDISANTTQIILNKEGEYEVGIFADGTLNVAFAEGVSWAWHSTGTVIARNTWTHIAVSYNAGVVTSYVNGTVVNSQALATTTIDDVYPGMNDLLIGGRTNNPAGQYFDGRIAEVRVWNVARSQAQIAASMNMSLAGNEVGLAGYWALDENAGATIADKTSNSNTGTLTNGPTWAGYRINEGTVLNAVSPGVLANDYDADGNPLTAVLVSGPAHGSLTLNVNGSFTYTPNAYWNGTDSFTYKNNDGTVDSNTATVFIVVNPVNDAPTASNLSAAETYTEDTPLNLTDIVVSDVDSANATVTLTLSAPAAGSLNTGTSGAVTSTYVAGTGVWTANGAIADINTLLAGLTFTPTLNYNSNFSISTSVSDGIAAPVTGSKAMTGVAVNDAPTITNGAIQILASTTEDITTSGISVSALLASAGWADVDNGTLSGIALTAKTGNGSWQYSTDGLSWTSFLPVSSSNALLLDSTSQIRYLPDHMNGETATFSFVAWDQTTGTASTFATASYANPGAGGGATAYSSQTASASLTVTSVNDAPTLGNGTLAAELEDAAAPAGQAVSTLFTGQFADVDAGSSFSGVAIVGNTANAGTQGIWQYSSNGGANWFAIGTVADNNTALAVSSSTLIRFVPVADYNGAPPALTVRGLDNSYAGGYSTSAGSETRINTNTITNGGTTAIAAATATLSTSITAVNDAPVCSAGTVGNLTVLEDAAATSLGLGALTYGPGGGSDETGQTFTYTVTAVPAASLGNITLADGTTVVTASTSYSLAQLQGMKFVAATNASGGPASFSWQVKDSGGTANGGVDTLNESLTVTVTAVNDAPAGADKIITTNEDATYVFTTADFGFSDTSDSPANTLLAVKISTLPVAGSLTWNNGTSDVAVTLGQTISATDITAGKLKFTPVANANGAGYASFTFQVQDNGGTANGGVNLDPAPKTMTVDVTAVNDAPVIISNGGGSTAGINVPENTTAVTTVTATDADLPAQTLTYSISGGADAALFAINSSTGVLSFVSTPNYESPTDNGGNNVYDVIVQVSDGSLTDTQAIAVSVTDVNDAPVITSNGGGSTAGTNVPENTTAVTTVTATDADLPAQTLTYSIVGGGDAAKFVIDSNTGALSFITPPDYENPQGSGTTSGVYVVTVGVSDGSLMDTQTLDIIVWNSNEPPVVTTSGTALAYTENAVATAIDPGLTVSDVDNTSLKSATVTLSSNYANGQDVLAFTNQLGITGSWSAATGVLSLTGPSTLANYQTALRSVTYVNTSDNPSVLARTVSFVVNDTTLASNAGTRIINVTPVDDPAIISGDISYPGNEGDTVTGTLIATDVDGLTAGTIFSVTGAASFGIAAIDAATGAWTFIPTDSNWFGSDSFTVTVTDDLGGTTTQVVSITLANVNDIPVITANTLSITEGTAVILDSTNLNTTDIEQGPSQLTYTVSNITYGQFEWAATPGAAITSFTQADVNAGQVVFVHDASDFAPSYDVTVSDGTDSQGPLAATINFTAVNEGINVSPASGSSTTEAGGTVTFDVTLNSQPFDTVIIFIVSSNAAEGTASVSSLTFTASNWNVAQQVTVTGVNDFIDDGDQVYSIQLQPATSADRNYNALDAADVVLTNLDDDIAGITMTPTSGLITSEAGASDTFSIVLSSQPLANVSIALSSSNTAEGVLSTNTLVFTPGNWNLPQIVTVTGVSDVLNDGDVIYQAIAGPASSADPLYNGIGAGSVDITNRDVADPILVGPVTVPPEPGSEPEVQPVDEVTVSTAEPVTPLAPHAEPIGGSGFDLDGARTNTLNTDQSSNLKPRTLLFFDESSRQHQELTNPDTEGGILLRLLEIIQADHVGSDTGSNSVSPSIHVEISQDEAFQVDIFRQGAKISAVSLSVGAVWWALRVGGMFASLLTSLPAWRSFDLLPVLSRDEEADEPPWELDENPDKNEPDSAMRPQEETA